MDIKKKTKEKRIQLLGGVIGICVAVVSLFYFFHAEKEGAEKRMVEIVNYVKVQCSTYTHYNESSESKSLLRAIESARQMSTNIDMETENGGRLSQEFLKENLQTLWVDGILVLDADGKTVKKYKADYEDISDTLTRSQWDAIHSGMREVVSTMDRFQGFDIPVAGKTGTAQQDGHANHGLFVGYAPYDDPEITIAVRIANGYNSHNAATAARNVISYYYKETSMKDIKEMKAAGANGNIRNSVAD